MRARMITAVALALTFTSFTTAAHADPSSTAATVDVVVEPTGFTAPASVAAGPTTFRIQSPDPEGAYLGVLRVRPGLTLRRVLADLERAYGHADRQDALAAARKLAREAEMHGGAAVLPGTPVSYTTELTAGTYHLIDFKDVGRPGLAEKVRTLRVRPTPWRPAHPPAAEIIQYPAQDGTSRFAAPAVINSGQPVRVINRSRQFNEAILMPVRPGTTREQVGAFFTEMNEGGQAPYPFTGGPVGMVPMSPGRSAVMAADLAPGTYALVTWLPDYRTGRGHAAQGMHEIITVE
ncbi:hypothetical protein AB0B45_31390 [Nonomuraea sp. NPDC049152]|uniref:hypothetical protein n=1 Tax=Nonomuraea sp. NPDC049152 TaxID=3154350 RepID=UPI0033C93E39